MDNKIKYSFFKKGRDLIQEHISGTELHFDILNDLNEFDGIVLYSLFQLPENSELRRTVFDKVLESNKFMLFVLEDMSLSCQRDKYYLENIFKIKTNLSKCPNNIN